MALEPQAALETAVRNGLRTTLRYRPEQCDRTFRGMPPAIAGNLFVGVWYDGTRQSQQRTCLDEVHGVYVTVTVRISLPQDRWIQHVDAVEVELNRIRALIHDDQEHFVLCAAAQAMLTTGAAGFTEALALEGFEPWRLEGGPWFQAAADDDMAGIVQTARFGKARRIQYLDSMV